MQSFILSQFGYCPLVWMLHSRKLNNRINRLHERALRLTYRDDNSTFDQLLEKDESVTVHERNIQTLGIELYTVAYGLAPEITRLVFPLNPQSLIKYPWDKNLFQTFNVKSTSWGLESLAHLGPIIWSIIPMEMKKLPLSQFSKAIRKWKPEKCPCTLCKTYVQNVGYVNVVNS